MSRERIDAPLDVGSPEHVTELLFDDVAGIAQQMMPEFVRESKPGSTGRIVGVDDQQRRLALMRAQPVASFAEGTECDIGGEVHLNQPWKVSYFGDAELEDATHLFGEDASLPLRFRRSTRRGRELGGDQLLYCSAAG